MIQRSELLSYKVMTARLNARTKRKGNRLETELQYMDVNHAFQLEAVVAVKGEQDPDE